MQEAYARWLVGKREERARATRGRKNGTTVLEICTAYLRHLKATGSASTFEMRARSLFDFCFGVPYRFCDKTGNGQCELTAKLKAQMTRERIHQGYGGLAASELKRLHVDQWLDAHENWDGSKRCHLQGVRRALNYGVEAGIIDANPISRFQVPRVNYRVTYLTPEQEDACYKTASKAMATAIRVCIRTGARPGCEFAALTAKHVIVEGTRMQWAFQASESKTKRMRIIRVTDPAIIAIVQKQIERHRKGPLFRNTKGRPWTRKNLTDQFNRLKKRLAKRGIVLDEDACMYSCRHTYAKRTLQGYWTGKVTNIETLARLMGNSPQICREHYLQWSEVDNDVVDCDHGCRQDVVRQGPAVKLQFHKGTT